MVTRRALHRVALRGIRIALEAFEVGAKLRRGLTANVAIFFQAFLDYFLQFRRNDGIEARRRNRRAIENIAKNDSGSAAAKRQDASSHFIKDHTERKKIRAWVQFFAAHLFRGHVGDGADGAAGASEELVLDGASLAVRNGSRL